MRELLPGVGHTLIDARLNELSMRYKSIKISNYLHTLFDSLECAEYQNAVYENITISAEFGFPEIHKLVDRCAFGSVPHISPGITALPKEFPHMVTMIRISIRNILRLNISSLICRRCWDTNRSPTVKLNITAVVH